jgi:hypothetical protein
MKRRLFLTILSALFFCIAANAEEGKTEAALWVLDVVKIPKEGVAVEVQGKVELLVKSKDWLPVSDGQSLKHGDRLWIHPSAALKIYFSESEYIEFTSAPKDRWVELDDLSFTPDT